MKKPLFETKKETHKTIIQALKDNGYRYQILNNNKRGFPNHLRVKGFGDIWPTTGTAFLEDGEKIHRNPAKLIIKIGGLRKETTEEKKPSKKSENLFDRLQKMEEKISFLENELDLLKDHLGAHEL